MFKYEYYKKYFMGWIGDWIGGKHPIKWYESKINELQIRIQEYRRLIDKNKGEIGPQIFKAMENKSVDEIGEEITKTKRQIAGGGIIAKPRLTNQRVEDLNKCIEIAGYKERIDKLNNDIDDYKKDMLRVHGMQPQTA